MGEAGPGPGLQTKDGGAGSWLCDGVTQSHRPAALSGLNCRYISTGSAPFLTVRISFRLPGNLEIPASLEPTLGSPFHGSALAGAGGTLGEAMPCSPCHPSHNQCLPAELLPDIGLWAWGEPGAF